MAIYRVHHGMMRKTSPEQAEAKQREMAQATLRRLTRKIANAPEGQYKDFLRECYQDVVKAPYLGQAVA